MKYIEKRKAPNCLTEYKKMTAATFQNIPTDCKVKIGDALLEEQGFICAYCMRRISKDWNAKLNKSKLEIEHYASQHRHPNLVLDYKNMLGVCNGNADNYPKKLLICDKSKSKFDKTHDLFLNPLKANREQQIYYVRSGKIVSDDERIKYDLDVILNLNEDDLCRRRAGLFKFIKKEIRKIKTRFWNNPKAKKNALDNLKIDWEKRYNGKFRELCRVPLYLIEKELSKQ